MARVGAGNGSSEAPSAAAAAAAPPPVAPPFMSVAAAGAHAGAVNGGVPSLHHYHQQQEAEEREAALIVESLRQWRRVGERKLFGLHLHVTKAISALGARGVGRAQRHQHQLHHQGGARASLAAPLTSKDILGVDLGEFTGVCLHTEKSCLKFLTAMLEGQSPGVMDHVRGSIDCWILFQVRHSV
jgi:hypothetical protein